MPCFPRARHRRAQGAVSGDPTRHGDASDARPPDGQAHLGDQGVRHRAAEGGAEVGEGRLPTLRLEPLHLPQQSRLQPAEAELDLLRVPERDGKIEGVGIPLLRQTVDLRPAGVGEPQDARGLVVGLACRILVVAASNTMWVLVAIVILGVDYL